MVALLAEGGGIHLNESTNDTQASEPQVFKRPRLAGCVQEGVKEKWHVRCTRSSSPNQHLNRQP